MSSFEAYPSWRFGPEGKSVIIHSAEEDAQLDESWTDTPSEGWESVKAPHYASVHLIERTFEQIVEKRKPGRPRKVE